WMLVSLIPFVGGIWLILLMCLDGSTGDNRYGSRPDGTTDIVPKSVLRQKALMWLTAFAVFGVYYLCFFFLNDKYNLSYTDTPQPINILLPLLGDFLVSVSFIVMGIAFLQKKGLLPNGGRMDSRCVCCPAHLGNPVDYTTNRFLS
uniref:DUF805 domain-containing protein n=1 Tax=Prevotella heparinolytica TaxID=28113 RepID=UPI00359F58C7